MTARVVSHLASAYLRDEEARRLVSAAERRMLFGFADYVTLQETVESLMIDDDHLAQAGLPYSADLKDDDAD